jgi:hypothetical protein
VPRLRRSGAVGGCRRIDDDSFCVLVDADDAIERMLALFGFLLMARQADDLLDLLPSEGRV